MSNKAIILDANILIRAVLGKRVRELIVENAATVKFFSTPIKTHPSMTVRELAALLEPSPSTLK